MNSPTTTQTPRWRIVIGKLDAIVVNLNAQRFPIGSFEKNKLEAHDDDDDAMGMKKELVIVRFIG
jgi:hypothetical protein